jgi:hypothetical protein
MCLDTITMFGIPVGSIFLTGAVKGSKDALVTTNNGPHCICDGLV